jgi:hypothetical protein
VIRGAIAGPPEIVAAFMEIHEHIAAGEDHAEINTSSPIFKGADFCSVNGIRV